MNKKQEDGANIDKQGRVCDNDGRPLRNKEAGKEPFHGKPGKPHKNTARLTERIKEYEALKNDGFTKPGSLKK